MTTLAFIYAAIAALGLALLLVRRGYRVRLVLVAVLPALAFAVYAAAQPPTGWPSRSHPPKSARFLWADVREPAGADRGEIDLWLMVGTRPRAFKLPYTRRLHQQIEGAKGMVKSGRRVEVARETGQRGGVWRFRLATPTLPPKQEGDP